MSTGLNFLFVVGFFVCGGGLFCFLMSLNNLTVQSLVESTVPWSGVEIISSGIKVQINNAKQISLEEQKHKFINVKIKIDVFRVGFSSPFRCLALDEIQSWPVCMSQKLLEHPCL